MTRRKPATVRGRRTRVALLIETSNAYARELLHGIQNYACETRHWALHITEQGRGETPPAWLRSWRGDGMIARVESKSVAEAARQAAVPVVNVSAAGLAPEFPAVISDSAAIARLAAEHLLERGFRHFESSVIPNARRAGYEAAALLDRMMRGQTRSPEVVLIEPVGVVTRQSTDVLAVSDPHISAAVRFIREHACERIGVEDARKVAALSRTLFERRFRKLLGCAPYEQILKVRLAKARELLAWTNLTLAEISARTGFSSPEYFSAALHKRLKTTPSKLRQRLRQRH